jgi:eight-cysteine-cluster-containing protein
MTIKNMKQLIIAIAFFLTLVALLSLGQLLNNRASEAVTSYTECVEKGYSVLEIYPEQCQTPDGRIFVNTARLINDSDSEIGVISNPDMVKPVASTSSSTPFISSTSTESPPLLEPISRAECKRVGCSRHICSDRDDIITTCEYRDEYACLKLSRCERQSDGQCGWTQTKEYQQCIYDINTQKKLLSQ